MKNTDSYFVADMLARQQSLNAEIFPDWIEKNFDWHRAIWTECAELAGHLNWEWWKAGEMDFYQARLELVDIWSFGMSLLLDQKKNEVDDGFVNKVVELLGQPRFTCHTGNLLAAVDQLAAEAAVHMFIPTGFATVMQGLDMTIADLHRWYVGKNTLNRFRQDNGYRQGSYQKIWLGREDNEHLADILGMATDTSLTLHDWVYMNLDLKYKSACRSSELSVAS